MRAGDDYGPASVSTNTERGGSWALRDESRSVAPVKAAGWTRFGASKVLCVSIAGAVRTRPETDVKFCPSMTMRASTVAGALGSRLTRLRWTRPRASREAEALIAGRDSLSRV